MKPSATLPRALAAAAALASLGACGSGVHTAHRGDPTANPGDPALVQVIDGSPDGELQLVSLSTWSVHVSDALPPTLPEGAVEAMRVGAAGLGATRLYLERVDSPHRKAFYGLGVVPSPGASVAPAPCDHPEYAEALADATRAADRCVATLRLERPALQGEITVVFQVDPEGEVMRAAATPSSTRDGQAQLCAVRAVHATDFGPPQALTCAGSLTIAFGDGGDDR